MVLAMFSGVLAAQPANAAEVNGVTAVDIVNAPPYVKDAQYQVAATWAVPDSAQPGDTFTLNFPDALVGFGASINLPDADGNIVGTCEVTANQFVCTLTDFVADHNNVHGTLNFNAKFVETFTEEQIEFTTGNNVTIVTDVEGGVGTAGPDTAPGSPTKFGYPNDDGTSMTWNIDVPSEDLGAGPNPIITDDYDSPLVFDPSRLTVRSIAKVDWEQRSDTSKWTYLGQGTGAGSYTLTDRPADTAFDVQLNGANTDGTRIYQVQVVMDWPEGAQNGDVFNNSAVVNGTTYNATPLPYAGAGGGGEGDNLGDIALTKTVTGSGAPQVAGTSYTVNYSYGTTNGTLTVTDGQTADLNDVPEGAVITLSEVQATGEGVVYSTPVFSGTGVTDNGDGTATVTMIDGLIEIGLENPVEQLLGGFDVTKVVTGSGAGVVADAEYTVNYSYIAAGETVTGSLVIADGETDGLAELPVGTVVTLSEVAPTAANVTYGTPVYTGTGVTDNGDGSASVTIGEGTISVGLENPVNFNLYSFAVTKTVTGDGAAKVVDMSYSVSYSAMVPGETEPREDTFEVRNGTVYSILEVPEGTVVTLSEVKATAPGVTFATPKFSGTGVTDNGDGTATFTQGAGLVEIGLENAVTVVPPTTPPTKPTTPKGGSNTSLAITGADSTPLIVIAGLLLASGAIALVARRRRGPRDRARPRAAEPGVPP
ncbi:Ig-like domain-containing protein, partial [Microbacterium sp. 22179]|uniref:Ig-like domain-containing protein n=1 Tax=Microbacterium sp. 22179 TaxID=3453886 RepID=UPI003F83D540